ncbi:MAG: hypothetical protein QXO51_06035 [Halobacteria archaeon]
MRRDAGYATLLDALIFLVLVSVAAALVFTTLSRSSGLQAARELRSQRLDSAAIDALLAVRPEGRDIGMRIGEGLLALYVDEKGRDPGLEGVVNDTLARLLGPRHRFNLTAAWRPVPWAGPEWRFAVGSPAPERATKVERVMTLPVADGFRELLDVRLEKINVVEEAAEVLNRSVEAVRLSLVRVKIAYCELCDGYNRKAEALERRLEERVKSSDRVWLEPVRADVFDVVVNDQWRFSEAVKGCSPEQGCFPEPDDINLQPGTWEVRPDVQALAAEALRERVRGLGLESARREARRWLMEEQLHPDRARVVLAIWQ